MTEGEGDGSRTLTFTQENSLEDFSVTLPAANGRVAYGSLGGRDGRDVVSSRTEAQQAFGVGEHR